MLRARQRHHSKSMRKRRQVLLQLVRRTAGRNKVNLVEIKSAIRGSSDGKMAIVNGVERSAKQRDAAWMDVLRRCAAPARWSILLQRTKLKLLDELAHKSSKQGSCCLFSHTFGMRPTTSRRRLHVDELYVQRTRCRLSRRLPVNQARRSGAGFGILSRASAIDRTKSLTPSPVAAEIA